MPLAIGISFPSGRFEATPWGHNVNEGVPEWPPSPWRFLRSLVAVWKSRLGHEPDLDEWMPSLFAALVAPPIYCLPRATVNHLRSYVPGHGKKRLVLATSVMVDPYTELQMLWPDVHLSPGQTQALALVLDNLVYFGRGESWCIARLCPFDAKPAELACDWSDPADNTPRPPDTDPIRTLCADPATWNAWDYRAPAPVPPWNLLGEVETLRAEGWSGPPGARWVHYHLPIVALATPVPIQPRRAPAAPAPTVNAVRYQLTGTPLIHVSETLYLGELIRRAVLHIYGDQNDSASSVALSGHTPEGKPVASVGHPHAYWLPEDADGDNWIDHVTVWAPMGFNEAELEALDAFRIVYGPNGIRQQLTYLGHGDICDLTHLAGPARRWRSVTPYVPQRFNKRYGRKRDKPDGFIQRCINEELEWRGWPFLHRLELLPRRQAWDFQRQRLVPEREMKWYEFRQMRVFGGGRRAPHDGVGCILHFSHAVSGPLAIGYAASFGLGFFAPIPDDESNDR